MDAAKERSLIHVTANNAMYGSRAGGICKMVGEKVSLKTLTSRLTARLIPKARAISFPFPNQVDKIAEEVTVILSPPRP